MESASTAVMPVRTKMRIESSSGLDPGCSAAMAAIARCAATTAAMTVMVRLIFMALAGEIRTIRQAGRRGDNVECAMPAMTRKMIRLAAIASTMPLKGLISQFCASRVRTKTAIASVGIRIFASPMMTAATIRRAKVGSVTAGSGPKRRSSQPRSGQLSSKEAPTARRYSNDRNDSRLEMDPGRDKRRGQDVAGETAEIDRRLQPYCRAGRLRSALAQPFDEMLLLKLADPLDQFDRAHLRESNLPLLAFDARDLGGEFGPLARDIFQLGRRFLAGRRPKAVELLLERLQLLIQLKFERARFGQDLLQTRAKGRQLVFRREHGAAERVARCTQRLSQRAIAAP